MGLKEKVTVDADEWLRTQQAGKRWPPKPPHLLETAEFSELRVAHVTIPAPVFSHVSQNYAAVPQGAKWPQRQPQGL